MPRTRVALIAAAAAVLAMPPAAHAKPRHVTPKPQRGRQVVQPRPSTASGTVLSINRRAHVVRVVTATRAVRAFRFRRALWGNVKPGTRVVLRVRGRNVVGIRVVSAARTVRFYGRVVSDGSQGLVLRLGDGKLFRIGARKRNRAASARTAIVRAADVPTPQLTVNVSGLRPGQVVLVTLTLGAGGNVSVSIKLVDSSAAADPVGSGDDGSTIDDNGGEDYEVDGTVTAVDAAAGTLTVQTGQGPLTFAADGLLDGVSVGDAVTVDYYRDLGDGTLVADDVFDSTAASAGDGGQGGGDTGQTADGSAADGAPAATGAAIRR